MFIEMCFEVVSQLKLGEMGRFVPADIFMHLDVAHFVTGSVVEVVFVFVIV